MAATISQKLSQVNKRVRELVFIVVLFAGAWVLSSLVVKLLWKVTGWTW